MKKLLSLILFSIFLTIGVMAIINSKPAKVIEKEKTVDLTNYKIDLKTLDLQIIEKENCVKEKSYIMKKMI